MAQRSRREFLKASTLAGVGFWVAGGVRGELRQAGPDERLNIAMIGAGGRASANLAAVQSENIVALCDVDETRYADAAKKHPNAALYTDFRVMLEKQKNIDAVVVSTPDHTHAVASIMAMRLGKHVYCEKPLTHSVWEARQMRTLASKMRVATQMGNGGAASDRQRTAVEIIRSGAIGDVREVHVWTDRPGKYWQQGFTAFNKGLPVPKTLHWDLWLGPAPERSYHTTLHPFRWRGWWDFGTGALGDMGCHIMSMPFMALRLGAPSAVSVETDEKVNSFSPPNGCRVTYEFPARGTLPACRVFWYEVRRPPMELFQGEKPSPGGSLIVGTKGTMYSGIGNHGLLPAKDFKGYEPPKPTLPRVGGQHHAEWIRACKGGPPAMSNFVDHAGPLTEMVLLGNVAMRVGKRIAWDAEKLRCVDCPAADQYIRREYRKGWSI